MKKIVPFKKDLIFKTNIAEITSISLEHSLHLEKENVVTGSFNVNGEYKITDASVNTESFSFELPFDINIDDKYQTDNIVLDIDDFYYEIVDSKILKVNIDVLIDKLEEKPLIETSERCVEEEFPFKEIENVMPVEISDTKEKEENYEISNFDDLKVEEKKQEVKEEISEKINVNSIFDSFDENTDNYASYYIYFYRENDSIEQIIEKYNITKDDLSLYNNLSDIKIGDKLIIPNEKV